MADDDRTTDPDWDETTPPGARLAQELRLLFGVFAERAEPWLTRLATAPDEAEHTPATCGWCPLCAGLAVLRGERPELAIRAAEHAAGLLAVLRASLADHDAAPCSSPSSSTSSSEQSSERADPTPDSEDEPAAAQRERVQRITIRRRGGAGSRP